MKFFHVKSHKKVFGKVPFLSSMPVFPQYQFLFMFSNCLPIHFLYSHLQSSTFSNSTPSSRSLQTYIPSPPHHPNHTSTPQHIRSTQLCAISTSKSSMRHPPRHHSRASTLRDDSTVGSDASMAAADAASNVAGAEGNLVDATTNSLAGATKYRALFKRESPGREIADNARRQDPCGETETTIVDRFSILTTQTMKATFASFRQENNTASHQPT